MAWNGNNNGLFLKVIIGVLCTGLVGAGGGIIKLYRDVGVLQSGVSFEARIVKLEDLATNIAQDRDKRTIVLQNLHDQIVELKQEQVILRSQMERLDPRGRTP